MSLDPRNPRNEAVKPVRLALIAASPMYYQVPLYRLVAADPRIDFTAIFASDAGIRPHDPGYGREIVWDTDLIGGYRSLFLQRHARNRIDGSPLSLRDLDVVGTVIRGRYDVLWVHGYNFITNILAVATQRLRHGKVLFREEQTLLHPRPLWKNVVKEAGLRFLLSQGMALYIGTQNRRWFARYGVEGSRLFFTPYCVDNAMLRQSAAKLRPQKQALRRAFGIDDRGGPVILTVSRLIAKKHPQLLLEAFWRVRRDFQCTLVVVGSGELEHELKRRVAADHIPDVVFTGFLNQREIPSAYSCADIFCLASREHETWGLVVNEAMNFELPVVVSDKVGSATDLVREGESGFVFPSDDVDSLEHALRRLLGSADLRELFGKKGLEIVGGWTHERAARGVLEATAKCVGPSRWREAEVR